MQAGFNPLNVIRENTQAALSLAGETDPERRTLIAETVAGLSCYAPGAPERLATAVAQQGDLLRCPLRGCWCQGMFGEVHLVPAPNRKLITIHAEILYGQLHRHTDPPICPEGQHTPCLRAGILAVVLVYLLTHEVPIEHLRRLSAAFPVPEDPIPSGTLVN